MRGADTAIYHRWQVSRNGNSSEWESVGAPPGAALNAPGGLIVFARSADNAVWHAWQDQPDGDWW